MPRAGLQNRRKESSIMSDKGFISKEMRVWMELEVPKEASGSLTDVVTIALNLTRFSAQFGVNSIPQASCAVAMGSTVPGTDKKSPIHLIIDKIRYRTKAIVYMTVNEGFELLPVGIQISEKEKYFDGRTFILFEGYTSGSGFRRSGSSIEYVLSLEHWLSDLNNSSALSPDLIPGVPLDLFFPATGIPGAPESLFGTIGAEFTLVGETISINDIKEDIWSALKKYFLAIANTNAVNPSSTPRLKLETRVQNPQDIFKSTKNTGAIEALGKFAAVENRFYRKIGLNPELASGNTPRFMLETYRKMTLSSFNGTTFWDNLISLGASFQFGVSPGISTAWVFPKLPNFKNQYKTIYDSEINNFDISTSMPKFIGGVVIKGNLADSAGTFSLRTQAEKDTASLLTNFASGMYFSKRHATNPAMVIMQVAPNWLALNMIPEEIDLILNRVAIPNALPDDALQEAALAKYGALTAYAKSVYNTEILKYRNGNVSGKFRLDIAPGSIVRIETAGESGKINVSDDTAQHPIYASVDQVSYSVDAINGQASTSFAVSNVRSEVENNDADLTTDVNPLYNSVWRGAPLIM